MPEQDPIRRAAEALYDDLSDPHMRKDNWLDMAESILRRELGEPADLPQWRERPNVPGRYVVCRWSTNLSKWMFDDTIEVCRPDLWDGWCNGLQFCVYGPLPFACQLPAPGQHGTQDAPCAWCGKPKDAHRAVDRLCPVPGVTSQFYTPK